MKIEYVVKFTLEGEEIETFEAYLRDKKRELEADGALEDRLEVAISRERLLVVSLRDQIQAAFDDGYLDGNFHIESVKETP